MIRKKKNFKKQPEHYYLLQLQKQRKSMKNKIQVRLLQLSDQNQTESIISTAVDTSCLQ